MASNNREFHACRDHARLAFAALMAGADADTIAHDQPAPRPPSDVLPGDSLTIDSRSGCAWCNKAVR